MENKKSLPLQLEVLWWIFTLIFTAGVLYPITNKIEHYPFLIMNAIFIIVFITFTRYVFLLKHTFIAKKQLLKIVLVFLCIPITAYLVNGVNDFQTFIDEQGFSAVVGDVPYSQQASMMNYIRSLLLFFGVGGVIITVLFAIRLVVSIWRVKNRGTI